jgi:hypothetical protein
MSSSITNTGLHDIAEILLKVALKHQKLTTMMNASSMIQTLGLWSLTTLSTIFQFYRGSQFY